MLKTMTILGTRPDLIKMSRVISELDRQTEHILVHTGQNFDWELNEVFFNDLEIRKPDFYLGVEAETPAKSIAQVIEKSDAVLKREQPDAVLFYGDTNSCLAVIAAKRSKIPVFHMEAGNRCFDERVPEELNRKVLDHLSDINLVLTEHARRYLISEGLRPETIIKTGSHMNEVLSYYMPKIKKSRITTELNLLNVPFFLASFHREENVDDEKNLKSILDALNSLSEKYKAPIIISTHPRTRKKLDALEKIDVSEKLKFLKPLSFTDYMSLMIQAKCTISDSGTITEEASLLNIPAITIRNTHERPEGMDVGTLILSGLNKEDVLDAVRVTIDQHENNAGFSLIPSDYSNSAVSKQIVKIILSYTHYINKTVWKKS